MPQKSKQKPIKRSVQESELPEEQNQKEVPVHPKQDNLKESPVREEKQMRKIQERQQMPTDKGELIQYLSERIRQAQQALNDTQQVLQSEISERQKISKSIEQRNKQLSKLYEVDQKGLPEKIKERLTQILTLTINQKLQAEQELQEQKFKNYEFRTRYGELKWQQQRLKHKLDELGTKQNTLNKDITTRESSIQNHQKELKELEEEFESFKEKKQALEDKYLQMKVALERMTDIKAVLNRFFANEDLFDQKMDLKEQKISRPQIHTPEQAQKTETRLPSRDNRNSTKLKPLNNSRKKQALDDQDFWKGDFTAKARNY